MQRIGFGANNFAFNALAFSMGTFDPLTLFAGGKKGVWYDPSDKTTLFQDAAGTVPVTKSGDPVGLMLDKSQGLVLGNEVVTNGTFNVNADNWIVGGGTIQAVGGRSLITAGVIFGSYQEIPTVVGTTYTISLDMQLVSAGSSISCRVSPSGNFNTIAESPVYADTVNHQGVSFKFSATATSMRIYLRVEGSSNQGYFDNISIKELKGNHAKQTLSAARPLSQMDGTKSWLYNDKVDDKLLVTLPAMTATVVTATDDGVTINYPVSIAAGSRDITSTSTLGRDYGRLIIDRELTVAEKTQVTAYFNAKRGV